MVATDCPSSGIPPRLAISLVVNIEEGAEYLPALGDKGPEPVDELGISLRKPVRNLANESNYCYGLLAGLPRITGLLATHRVRCTFAAAAQALRLMGEQARELVASGHEICAHGNRWVHQYLMDRDDESGFIRDAVCTIEEVAGVRPVGWLSRYLFTENTRSLLAEQGFQYHMDDYSDDVPRIERVATSAGDRPIVVIPYALDTNDMKLWMNPAYTPRDWLDYAIDSFDVLHAESLERRKLLSLGIHLRIMGRPGRIGALERFIRHVHQHQRAAFVTRSEIARWALGGLYAP